MSEAREQYRYTWKDYRAWPSDERIELIDGHVYAMNSPATRHQRISADLTTAMVNAFSGNPCQVYAAPMDVKLSDEDVVQPDLLVVCDGKKVTETHIEGTPDLVIEILSPSTTSHDRVRKLNLYASFGIREYWIITPYPHIVEVFSLQGGKYLLDGVYSKKDTLRSPAFPELEIPLESIFDFDVPPDEQIDRVRELPPPYPAHAIQV